MKDAIKQTEAEMRKGKHEFKMQHGFEDSRLYTSVWILYSNTYFSIP